MSTAQAARKFWLSWGRRVRGARTGVRWVWDGRGTSGGQILHMPKLRRPQVHGTATHGTIVHTPVEQISQTTSMDQLAATPIEFCNGPTTIGVGGPMH